VKVSLQNSEALVHALLERLPADPYWQASLQRVHSADADVHIAIFHEPFLSLLLAGRKTVESRYSKNRVAPFEAVSAGDLLLLKRSSGPIVGVAVAGNPGFYELDEDAWLDIRTRFARAICAPDEDFWLQREHARFATLIPIAAVTTVEEFLIEKRDRRGWALLARHTMASAAAWA
jgi:hypothetical protein